MIKRVSFLISVLFLTGCQAAMTTLKGDHRMDSGQSSPVQPQAILDEEAKDSKNVPLQGQAVNAGAQRSPALTQRLSESEQLTQNLIKQGHKALSGKRLLTPEDDNANLYFQAALGRDPGNFDAIQGISKIVDLYTEWAWQAALNRQYQSAARYLSLAQSVNPDDPVLREMSSRIKDLQERRSVSSVIQNTASNGQLHRRTDKSSSAVNDNQENKPRVNPSSVKGQFNLPKDLFSRSEEEIILQVQPIIDQVSALQSSIVIYWPSDKEARLLYQIINSRVTEFRVRAMTYHRADYRVELQQD